MKRSRTSGFTMIEVMIALLITSMMLVTITDVLSIARRTRDVIHNARESQLAGPAILDLIEADLRGLFVQNRRVADVLRIEDNAISGMDADRIDFVTSGNNRMLTPNADRTRYLRADVSEVGYCLKTNLALDGEFLEIWRREGFGVDDEPFSGGQFTFLSDRVLRFDIQVFNEDGPDGEPLESWGLPDADEDARGLPTRIEIELELEPAARLLNEQSARARSAKRRVLYRRIIHFPASLQLALTVKPVLSVPRIEPPQVEGGRVTNQTGPAGAPPPGAGGGIPPGGGDPPIQIPPMGGGAGAGGGVPPPIFGGGGG